MRKRNAFTLIELLVVVTIIGLLISVLVPSLARARKQARRSACAAQLHNVGIALVSYQHDNNDRMPYASFMPSISPFPLNTEESVYIADVLGAHTKGQDKVFHCPEDQPNRTFRENPNTGLSFFDSERSSYAYRFSLAGLTPTEFDNRPRRRRSVNVDAPPNTVWVMRDYANFHGKAGENGSRRYLYIDGHVSDFEN